MQNKVWKKISLKTNIRLGTTEKSLFAVHIATVSFSNDVADDVIV